MLRIKSVFKPAHYGKRGAVIFPASLTVEDENGTCVWVQFNMLKYTEKHDELAAKIAKVIEEHCKNNQEEEK